MSGRVDTETRRVVSEGTVVLKRLDIIGISVPDGDRETLGRYAAGEIGLREMTGMLGAER